MRLSTAGWRRRQISVITVLLCSFVGSLAFAAETLKLSILHMNDPHGHYAASEDKVGPVGGFGKAQTILKEVSSHNSAEGTETLILMAGDLLTGTPFSMVFKGRMGVDLMNKMGFHAMVVGNHEFDYGQDNLFKVLMPLVQFPLLSSNTRTSSGQNVFESLIEKRYPSSGTRIIIFGVTTQETPITTHPNNIKGLVFEDPISTATELLKDVKDEDLVIALTHIGIHEDKKLAEACPKIDVIIGGHTHTKIDPPVKVGNTIICQADAYAKYVGRLNLETVDGIVVRHHGELIRLGPDVKEDPQIAAVIEKYKSEMGPELGKVIGKTNVFLEGGRSAIRSGKDTNLGRLLTFLMADYAKADLAVTNGGGIRESIKEGDITMSDVFTVLPFSNIVVKMDLSGEDLQKVLQFSQDLEPGSGGKLQTFGIAYSLKNGKVIIDSIRGKSFDHASSYSVATNDFLASGGDGYSILKENGMNCYNYAEQVSDLLIDFIKHRQIVTKDLIERLN